MTEIEDVEVVKAYYQEWSEFNAAEIDKIFGSISETRCTIGSLYWLAKPYDTENELSFRLDGYTAQYKINKKYIPKDLQIPPGTFFFMKSEKGTGKTEWLHNVLDDYINKKTYYADGVNKVPIHMIGHRRALLRQAANRLGEFKIKYYEDFKGKFADLKISSAPKLAITCDSLARFDVKQGLQYLDRGGIVILDEVSQVLRHLQGETCYKTRAKIVANLIWLIKRAIIVICLDADLTDKEVEYLAALDTRKSTVVFENIYRDSHHQITAYAKSENLLENAKLSLVNGESVYFACNTREQANTTFTYLKKYAKASHLVTAETIGSIATTEFVSNINKAIETTQLTVASPSLGTGIDIQYPIDNVYLLADNFDQINHKDLLQQLFRVRNPKKIHTYVNTTIRKKTTDYRLIKQEAFNTLLFFFEEFDPDTGLAQIIRNTYEQAYVDFWAKSKAWHNYSTNNLSRHFYKELANYGDVEWFDKEEVDEELLEELAGIKALRDQQKIDYLEAVCNVNLPDRDEIRKIEKKKEYEYTLNDREKKILLKHRVELLYGECTPDLIEKFDYGKGWEVYRLFRAVLNTKEFEVDRFRVGDLQFRSDEEDYAWKIYTPTRFPYAKKDQNEKFFYPHGKFLGNCYPQQFLPDISHRQRKAHMIKSAICIAFEIADVKDLFEYAPDSIYISPTSAKKLSEWIQKNKLPLKELFNISCFKNIKVIGNLLKACGLTLIKGKRIRVEKTRFQQYNLDFESLEFMMKLVMYQMVQRYNGQTEYLDGPDKYNNPYSFEGIEDHLLCNDFGWVLEDNYDAFNLKLFYSAIEQDKKVPNTDTAYVQYQMEMAVGLSGGSLEGFF